MKNRKPYGKKNYLHYDFSASPKDTIQVSLSSQANLKLLNEMIYLKMALPPSKKLLNLPTKQIDESYLGSFYICSVCDYPVDLLLHSKTHKIYRMLHSMIFVTQNQLNW